MIHELYTTLSNLVPSFKELYKKNKLRIANKTTFNEILGHLLILYDDNTISLNLSDEEIIQLFRDLGYPYIIRDDVLKVIGAPHNWNQIISMLHWLSQVVDENTEGKRPSVDLLCDEETYTDTYEDTIFDIVRKGIEKKVRVDDLSHNYIHQQDIRSEEMRCVEMLQTINNETQAMRSQIETINQSYTPIEVISSQLEVISKEAHLASQSIDEYNSLLSSEETKIENETIRASSIQTTMNSIQDRMDEICETINNQAIDFDTYNTILKDNLADASHNNSLQAQIDGKNSKKVDLYTIYTDNTNIINMIMNDYKTKISAIHVSSPSLSLDMPKETYHSTYSEIISHVGGILADSKAYLESVIVSEGEKKVVLSGVVSDNRHLDDLIKQHDISIRLLKDNIQKIEKEKSSKEKDYESKKINITNDIYSYSNQLDKITKEVGEMEFEYTHITREYTQMMTLVKQHLEHSGQILLAVKKEHQDKLFVEADRLRTIKEELDSYINKRKK